MGTEVMIATISQHGGALGWAGAGACVVATALAGLRWLRVAQREHYLPDSASRFAFRWWNASVLNRLGVVFALAGLVLAARWVVASLSPAVVTAVGPLGLGLRGRTSHLRWTRRLRTLAAVWATLQVAVILVGVFSGFAAVVCAAGALLCPALVDVACLATAPLERRLADHHVLRAQRKLQRVSPKVVAITGSYGKTSTKGYVTHLLSASMAAVGSPASFNNRAGLARAVNENLPLGTEVFVAEMGTYGRGEIAELCTWLPPDVAVITAIGPVHLERFGSEEEIVIAKSEILEKAPVCVLVVDDPRLSELAELAEARGKRVWRVSGKPKSEFAPSKEPDVRVAGHAEGLAVWVRGEELAASVTSSARPGNVACAVAVALELGVPSAEVAKRLPSLPGTPHRLEAHPSERGFVVLDDTYNSNPAGARAALSALAAAACDGGRRAVVTPGMVELGRHQADENSRFAQEAVTVATDFVVVGRTNRRALKHGYSKAVAAGNGGDHASGPVLVDHREEAVAWVQEHLGPGDVVLYENDLPDHYP